MAPPKRITPIPLATLPSPVGTFRAVLAYRLRVYSLDVLDAYDGIRSHWPMYRSLSYDFERDRMETCAERARPLAAGILARYIADLAVLTDERAPTPRIIVPIAPVRKAPTDADRAAMLALITGPRRASIPPDVESST